MLVNECKLRFRNTDTSLKTATGLFFLTNCENWASKLRIKFLLRIYEPSSEALFVYRLIRKNSSFSDSLCFFMKYLPLISEIALIKKLRAEHNVFVNYNFGGV